VCALKTLQRINDRERILAVAAGRCCITALARALCITVAGEKNDFEIVTDALLLDSWCSTCSRRRRRAYCNSACCPVMAMGDGAGNKSANAQDCMQAVEYMINRLGASTILNEGQRAHLKGFAFGVIAPQRQPA